MPWPNGWKWKSRADKTRNLVFGYLVLHRNQKKLLVGLHNYKQVHVPAHAHGRVEEC